MDFIDTLWKENPKLAVVFVSSLITILIMIIKYNYDEWKKNTQIIESSKFYLSSFARVLHSAISNNEISLATEHYKILLSASSVFKNKNELYSYYSDLHKYYISLQIGNYKDQKVKQETDLNSIDKIIKFLDKENYNV